MAAAALLPLPALLPLAGRRFVLNWGMGADSTAVVLRFIFEPDTRPCPPGELLVVTAMTGDEKQVTRRLGERHILPLFREHGIRWIQVARAGATQADGITVWEDGHRIHLKGDYRLSQEMIAAGTVPQRAGCRKCSLKAKGWPIDQFLHAELAGEPFVQVMGYEVNEPTRRRDDMRCNTAQRTGDYPLARWGWDRATCERYIHQITGVWWPKSACSYCVFALATADGRKRALAEYAAEPEAAVQALIMERIALALNPRQSLIDGGSLHDLLAWSPRHAHVMDAYRRALGRLLWRVYEVRRAIRESGKTPGKEGQKPRKLTHLSTWTTEAEARAALVTAAGVRGVPVERDGGIERAWLYHRAPTVPTREHLLVIAPLIPPDGPWDKTGPGFANGWAEALAAESRNLALPLHRGTG